MLPATTIGLRGSMIRPHAASSRQGPPYNVTVAPGNARQPDPTPRPMGLLPRNLPVKTDDIVAHHHHSQLASAGQRNGRCRPCTAAVVAADAGGYGIRKGSALVGLWAGVV